MSGRNGRNPKSPAFQWYPGDFLADPRVAAMTCLEIGAYRLLLDFEWLDGPLPNDHAFLARLARLTARDFEAIWAAVGRCFSTTDDGLLVNARLERERAFQSSSRERRLAASRTAVEARGQRIVNESSTNRTTVGPLTRDPIPETRDPRPVQKKQRAPRAAPAAPIASTEVVPSKPSSHQEFMAWWAAAYRDRFGSPYPFAAGKDGMHVKRCLERLHGDLSDLKARASRLLLKPAEWMARGGIDLGSLECHLAKLATLDVEPISTGEMLLMERRLATPDLPTIDVRTNGHARIGA